VRLVLVLAFVLATSACATQGVPQAHEAADQEAQSLDLPPLPPGPPADPRCLVDLTSVSLPEMIEGATYIVLVRVIEVGGSESVSGSSYYRVRSKLVEALRGRVDATLDFALINCGGARYDFKLEEDYLIFAEPLTFGGKLKVIAPMGYRQGVFRVSEDGQAAGIRGTVGVDELRDHLLPSPPPHPASVSACLFDPVSDAR
jgi:hypothetical protein